MAEVLGGPFADALIGTSGSDVLTGGPAHDVFVLDARGGAQTDVVTDFGGTYFGGAVTGSQQVPPVNSPASGTLTAWLNRAQTELNFTANITGLDFAGQTPSTGDDVIAAHVHRDGPGINFGLLFGFIGTPNHEMGGETRVELPPPAIDRVLRPVTVTGSWDANEGNLTTLTASLPYLLGNELYVDFHTVARPSGELRGQLTTLDRGLDQVEVRGLGIGDYETLLHVMREVGGSTSIAFNSNDRTSTLVLQGVPIARLSSSDFIFAEPADRTAWGSSGSDDLFGAGGNDWILSQDGADRVFAGQGNDTVEGGRGADTVLGLGGDDRLIGGEGDDDVNGNLGQDQVDGQEGADSVRGGHGADTVMGGPGDDPHVNGNTGADVVYGGGGHDTLYGGRDNDTLYGDAGDDGLSGDLGADLLFGGAGADRFLLRPGSGADWVGDFNAAEGDRVHLVAGTTYTLSSHQNQLLITLGNGDQIGLAGVASTGFSSDWLVFG